MQNTTFLDCVFRSVGITEILAGYGFGALSPAKAETIPNLLARSDISLKGSPNVGAKLHQVQTGDTLYSLTQMYQVDAAAIATSSYRSSPTF
ncbi:LysM domain-containing protein [Pseudanabaena sp. 'Roaring Creek']|uniref:LysM peptidoglycan-binding domain-containing protein n=1 Tax=Pseudanabaena sp. 'Roaring Creek' TaxID=1681830 RepID=UPI0012E1626C|nr:LysM domain-containing protein [Pseudanabaena sp. 'Roaring Creek']